MIYHFAHYLDIYPPSLHYYLLILLMLLLNYNCLFVHTYVICHEKHTANIQMKLVNMVRFH